MEQVFSIPGEGDVKQLLHMGSRGLSTRAIEKKKVLSYVPMKGIKATNWCMKTEILKTV